MIASFFGLSKNLKLKNNTGTVLTIFEPDFLLSNRLDELTATMSETIASFCHPFLKRQIEEVEEY